ncbi:hypothetical protein CHS0354_023961 [Potamilus streckersoni]|uniref:tRNA (guanine-N(1)-)-methyltransferase n=1 Tax=Potamilus streckersoni TaxID=2493646 RepID=A0AAE0RZZ9_9BIVA|nr:hypothetical protein CHS0354_023961 [Potamilus streckersoni]
MNKGHLNKIKVAYFLKPFGLKGEIKAEILTDFPNRFLREFIYTYGVDGETTVGTKLKDCHSLLSLGTLRDVMKFPANDVYVIQTLANSDVLFPATPEFVAEVNVAKKLIFVNRFDVISVIPGFFGSAMSYGLLSIASKKQKISVHLHNLYEFVSEDYPRVDDTPYGGGAGMILRPEPIFNCIEELKQQRNYDEIIFVSPDGERFTQRFANTLSLLRNVILLAGHYKGIDERVRMALITKEISIGDYVLSGGEIPALCVMDAVARLIPGVLGDFESALTDSFQEDRLDCGYFTRPVLYKGMEVPPVLRSGNHKQISEWRECDSQLKTKARRPDMIS